MDKSSAITIACIQMEPSFGDTAANVEASVRRIVEEGHLVLRGYEGADRAATGRYRNGWRTG